ncbi:hypothetical protein K490DRAFT_70470 [Saccharata proteae CBS 121410]|uniref:Uncharacterized protein n=1 Tax=Saccharata proteae CBS 121410 TaxID=1314787 RepID=A0A9P4I3Y3_9PEZI|nr:hypothetical protein K490DRAFT_70470 [Saccharata proteae CBS 121410]
MLRQTILGYISAGWPREDIVIVDNSGTLDANNEGRLSSDNPFRIPYELYRNRYGVAILQTPTLYNFAQLQNLFLRIGIAHGWSYFFWSHMDVGILGDEDVVPYRSFYSRVLDILDGSLEPDRESNSTWSLESMRPATGAWAIKFFEFDNLALVNVEAWRTIGQWDTFVPYYSTDCDAYARLLLHGFTKDNVHAGHIFDVANTIDDPETKFFPAAKSDLDTTPAASRLHDNGTGADTGKPDATAAEANATLAPLDLDQLPDSPRYRNLLRELRTLQDVKYSTERNSWQDRQKGGRGEAWTYDPRGFQAAWWDTAQCGRELYTRKWGTLDCKLLGVTLDDMWKGDIVFDVM